MKAKQKGKAKKAKPARQPKPKREIPPRTREAASAALKGNQFWTLRAKHGRDALFANADALWESACEYFQYTTDNPEYETKPMVVSHGQFYGSTIEMVQVPVKSPFTLQMLCVYFGCSTSWFRNFKRNTTDKDFLTVIERIEEVIFHQKFSGAASGFFNANIIARELGLRDSTDVTTDGRPLAPEKITKVEIVKTVLDEDTGGA